TITLADKKRSDKFEPAGGAIVQAVASSDGTCVIATLRELTPAGRPTMPARRIAAWEVSTGKLLFATDADLKGIAAAALSHDGKLAAVVGPSRSLRVWETATGKEIASIKTPESFVVFLAFTADNKALVSGNGPVWIRWDLETRTESSRFESKLGVPMA